MLEQTQGLHLHGKCRVNVFILPASSGQKLQFWANFDLWGLTYQPPFTDEGHIWYARVDRRSTLVHQILSECVHCVGFWWPKSQFWTNFDFWGSCTDALLSMSAKFSVLNQISSIRLRAKTLLGQFIMSPSGGERPQFRIRHLVMSPFGSSLRKLNTVAQ